jgi:hypothetical protein
MAIERHWIVDTGRDGSPTCLGEAQRRRSRPAGPVPRLYHEHHPVREETPAAGIIRFSFKSIRAIFHAVVYGHRH